MTLNTPSIHLINAFDPINECTFDFYYVGNQIYSNRAVITDNDTQMVVYDNTQNSMKNSHILPPNTLTSGKSYAIQIQVFDDNGNSSDLSMSVLFYCFSSPLFYFQNVNNGDTISTANLELKLSYEQSENELLSEYKYNVYDVKKEEIYSSKIYYGTSEELTHTIYGLKNESTYFIRATGITSHGIIVDTGYIEIHVSHTTIKPDIAFVATNDKTNGCIVLQTNIFTVSYDVENNNYSVQDGLVDLKDNVLTYKTGANGDFSLVLNAKQLPIGTFLNCNDNLLCLSVVCISDVYYCNLQIKTRSETYNIFKELTDVIVKDDNYIVLDESMYSDDTLFSFGIHRNNNVYDLQLYHSSIGILKSAQGTIISITDSAKVKPKNIKLFGKSIQNGTPSMDNEVAVESLGESGSIVITIEENGLSATFQTPNGLREGDVVDYASGKKLQSAKELNLADYTWIQGNANNYGDGNIFYAVNSAEFGKGLFCTHARVIDYGMTWEQLYVNECILDGDYAIFCTTHSTLTDFTTWLSNANVRALIEMQEPTITDLTQEEIDQYNNLVMNYPNTTIVNDAGAYMEVEYVADITNATL